MIKPKIRFDNNYPEWAVVKVEDIIDYERPDKYIVKSDIYCGFGVPVLTANKSFILGFTDESEGVYEGTSAIIFDDFTCDSKYVDFPFKVKSSAIKILKSKDDNETSLKFFFECLNSKAYKPKGHQRHWIGIIQKQELAIPCYQEQQKIAAFFTALDEKISLTMEKISSIRKINNKLVSDILDGGIRFSSANGQPFPNWKREKFCKSFSVKMCKRIFKEETLDKGDVPFYKIGTFGGKADSYITNELFESYKKKYSYPSKGDTLISCSGTVGRCVIFDGSPSYFQDSNIVWLEPNDKNLDYDKFYLTSVLENLRWDSLSSSTIKRIYSKDLLEKEWFIPCLDEQQIIAEFISMLNNKLAIENEKLSSLMKLKMAFMQQMFV